MQKKKKNTHPQCYLKGQLSSRYCEIQKRKQKQHKIVSQEICITNLSGRQEP